jgi:lysine 2,3-aminomutase
MKNAGTESGESEHRLLREDEYWRHVPGFSQVAAEEFHAHLFQQRHTVTHVGQLRTVLGDLVGEDFFADLEAGLCRAPMALRVSPHLLSLVDWNSPQRDPIRLQFLPLASSQKPDHPMLRLDSLGERADSPVPGLTHRYRDKALFLPVDTCPVYCRFCTRSYAVGGDTELVGEKLKLHANLARWERAIEYIESQPALEDIVISGGDAYNLKAEHVELLGMRLLRIPHIRRIRFATKGLCVMPQKILTDTKWTDALTRVVEGARRLHKTAVLHTHFNSPREIVGVTRRAMNVLVERGITVRCQTVLQKGVNDLPGVLPLLVRRLGYVNIQPYYVYVHDMVPGVEDLRTSLQAGVDLEKNVRGSTAGFHTPAFVVDTLGGGGKRDVHSFECYDRETGVAVYTSPAVRPGRWFLYFDPLETLPERSRVRWQTRGERELMIGEALRAAGASEREIREVVGDAAGEPVLVSG